MRSFIQVSLFLILACCFLWGADDDCDRLVFGLSVSDINELILTGQTTPYHIGEERTILARAILPETFTSLGDVKYDTVINGVVPRSNFPLLVTRARGDFIELRDLWGNPYYYQLGIRGNGGVRLYHKLPFAATPWKKEPSPQDPARSFKKRKDLDVFAKELAELQLEASSTYRDANGLLKTKLTANAVKTNRAMLERLAGYEDFTEDDLRSWLQLLGADTPEQFQSPHTIHGLGIFRGEVVKRSIGEKEVVYDLRKTEAFMTYVSSSGQMIRAIPPGEVKERLTALVRRINHLDHESPFSDSVAIYRELMTIHPSQEMNGRVGVVLLNYCLMRSGFPPIPKTLKDSIHLSLWANNASATDELARLYTP